MKTSHSKSAVLDWIWASFVWLIVAAMGLHTFGCSKLNDLQERIRDAVPNNGDASANPPPPNSTVQIPNVSDEELIEIVAQSRTLPAQNSSLTLESRQTYRPTTNEDYSAQFLEEKSLLIAESITVRSGRSGTHWATFRFTNTNEDENDVTCFYQGQGQSTRSNNCTTNSTNGFTYRFQYCMRTSTSTSLDCRGNPNKPPCRDTTAHTKLHFQPDLSLGQYQEFHAKALYLSILNGDNGCPATAVSLTLKTPSVAVTCGSVLDQSHTLTSDITCPERKLPLLTIIGTNVVFDGAGFELSGPQAKVGLLLLGENITVRNLKISGEKYGIGILAHQTNGLVVHHTDVDQRGIGFDFIGLTSLGIPPVLNNNRITNSHQQDIRERDDFGTP